MTSDRGKAGNRALRRVVATQDSHLPSAGRKPGTGPPGRKPRVSRAASLPEALGETPLPGLSRLAEASAVLGQWPRFVSSKPAAWHLEPPLRCRSLLAAPRGRAGPTCTAQAALRVWRPSEWQPQFSPSPRYVAVAVPGRRTWTFRGAVILPNSPSISQGNMFWIYLGACRKSFFYS